MAHRFGELTGPAWLAKRVRLSLVALAISLLIGGAGLALSGNWLVSAQRNDFDAEAEDIRLFPLTVYSGQLGSINARFQNLSPSTGPHGGEATFDVTIYVEPPTGTATRFSWDNEVFALDQERTFNKAYTFAEAGTYTVRAEIYDINGQQSGWNADNRFDQLTETFTVRAQTNSAPSVSVVSPSSPVSLYTGDSQTFQVSATDSDSNMTKWKWEVDKRFSLLHGHQEPEETFNATGSITKSFSHTFPDNGTYTVEVTFTDSEGESGTAEWRVEVEDPPNRAPSVTRVSPSSLDYVRTGDVSFTANANDPDDNL